MIEGRTSAVPFEHMIAELAASPIATPEMIGIANHRLNADLTGNTDRVWRLTEQKLLQQSAAYSVDELAALRDWLWFFSKETQINGAANPERENLTQYFRNLAQSTLKLSGSGFSPILPSWSNQTINVRVSNDDSLARRFWRWMQFSMPPDLLIAAHPNSVGNTDDMQVMSPVIDKLLLDRGYAEPHLHLGAALQFNSIWVAMQYEIGKTNSFYSNSFKSAGADFNDGEHLATIVLKGLIARYLLAAYLAFNRSQSEKNGQTKISTFYAYLNTTLFPKDVYRHPFLDETQPRWLESLMPGEYRKSDTVSRNEQLPWSMERIIYKVLVELETGSILKNMEYPTQNEFKSKSQNKADNEAISFTELQICYSDLTNMSRRNGFAKFFSEVGASDPISDFFATANQAASNPEIDFYRTAFQYMESSNGQKDIIFAKVFWQVVRTRTQFYRHIIQRPMIPGLQWFIRHFERLKPAKKSISDAFKIESAAVISGKDLGLRSLEVRISPESESVEKNREVLNELYTTIHGLNYPKADDGGHHTSSHNKNFDRYFASINTKGRENERERLFDNDHHTNTPIEFGIVYHFARVAGYQRRSGLPRADAYGSHSDPIDGGEKKNAGFRYGSYYREKRKEAVALCNLLARYPRALDIVRAIDVCTDELAIPNWVLAPLIRYVREVSVHIAKNYEQRAGEKVDPLRLTAHVGEDFVHLLGGLRRVDETVKYFGLEQGDRLGHAIALGIDPRQWASSTRGVAMTKMDRLFDLAWEARFCTSHQLSVSGSRLQFVNSTLETLGRDIFRDEHVVARDILDFTEALYDQKILSEIGFPRVKSFNHMAQLLKRNDRQNKKTSQVKRLLALYLTDQQVFRTGQEKILIETTSESEQLNILQNALRQQIGGLGIAIEINPSSNLLIGNLSDLKNHPLWRLKSPIREDSNSALSVCIGSDDPVTFATDTRFEYQLVYDTLLLSGVNDFEARSWIEDARSVGMNNRFTKMVAFLPHELWVNEGNWKNYVVDPPP